jgi:two-component sensor histidine kinase
MKYGALSSAEGHISISGRLDRNQGDDSFVFTWKEDGGPRVSLPTRRGFGSVILLEAAQQLGVVSMTYSPGGLIYQLRTHLGGIELKSAEVLPTANAAGAKETRH